MNLLNVIIPVNLILAILLPTACASPAPKPDSTLPITLLIDSPIPSSPLPPTSAPQAELESTVMLFEERLQGLNISKTDSFEVLSDQSWEYSPGMFEVTDGVLEMHGQPSWLADLFSKGTGIQQGHGIALRFNYPEEATFSIGLLHGTWEVPDCRLFGFTHPRPAYFGVDAWEGRTELAHGVRPAGELGFRNNTWYEIMIAVEKEGEIMYVIWDLSEPSQQRIYRNVFGEGWSDLDWKMWVNGDRGRVLLDDYVEFSFNSIN